MERRPIYTRPVPPWPIYDASDVRCVRDLCGVLSDPATIGDALFPSGQTGPIAALCEAIRGYFGVPYAFCVNSGWSAGLAILCALQPEPGDRWIVGSYAHGQGISAFRLFGVEPVFVDPDDTLNLDPDRIESRIDGRTRGIWVTHVHGNPCRMDAISEIARRHGLLLVEDGCQSWGARYGGRLVGTFGNLAFFSFCAPKQISSGNGGCVITPDRDLFRRVVLAAGRQGAAFQECFGSPMDARENLRARGYYEPVEIGDRSFYSDTLTFTLDIAPIEAAVAANKILGVDARNAEIVRHAALFRDTLAGEPVTFSRAYPEASPVHMRLDLHVGFAELGVDRRAFIRFCKEEGIGAEIESPPEHLPSVKRMGGGPRTFDDRGWLSLASYRWYSPEATPGVLQIAEVLRQGLRACRL